jgi:hypothetical protein
MEEDQNNQPQESQESQEPQEPKQQTPFGQNPNGVSFPTVAQQPNSGGPKTILIVGILILVAILGFVVYKSATGKAESTPEPTTFDNQIEGSQNSGFSTPTTQPTSIPADKSKISVVVQNGTGITGEAAYLQTQLKNLGYTNVKVGNASDQTVSTTAVTFSKSLSQDIVTEITQELNSIYQKTIATTASSGTSDVLIVTGLRKGATARPSATPTPKPSAFPTASPSPSPTATPI